MSDNGYTLPSKPGTQWNQISTMVYPDYVIWQNGKSVVQGGDADGNRTPATHGLSETLSDPKPRLYLPLESSIRLSSAASDARSDVLHVTLSHIPIASHLVDLWTHGWGLSPPAGPPWPAFLACLDAASGKMKDCDQAN